jgi:hypothetical protein
MRDRAAGLDDLPAAAAVSVPLIVHDVDLWSEGLYIALLLTAVWAAVLLGQRPSFGIVELAHRHRRVLLPLLVPVGITVFITVTAYGSVRFRVAVSIPDSCLTFSERI